MPDMSTQLYNINNHAYTKFLQTSLINQPYNLHHDDIQNHNCKTGQLNQFMLDLQVITQYTHKF